MPVSPVSTTVCAPGLLEPVVPPITFGPDDVAVAEVARYLGGYGYRPDEKITDRIVEAIACGCRLVRPAVRCRLVPVERAGAAIRLPDGTSISAPGGFGAAMPGMVAVVIGTLGGGLEEKCRQYAAQGRVFDSALLDAVGTVMLDLLGMRVTRALEDAASACGLWPGQRLSPGVEGFPLDEQTRLFRLAGDDTAGVVLNPSRVMVPGKSISFFLLLCEHPSGESSGEHKCSQCTRDHCQFRKITVEETFG